MKKPETDRLKGRLRICLLSYRGNPYCGGQGIYVQYLAKELVQLGHEVHVLVGPPYPISMDGAREHRIPNQIYFGYSTAQILSKAPARALLSPINLYEYASSRFGVFPEIRAFSLRAYFHLHDMLRNRGFDILHDNQCLGYGYLLMRRFGIPIVSTIHHPLSIDRETWFESPSTLKKKIKMVLYYPLVMQRIVANRLDGIVTVSHDSARQINRAFKVPKDRIRVVYNGLDADVFRPIREVPKRVIFVGNVADRKKGISYLLEAMTKLDPNTHLIVVDGGTPARVSTQNLIQTYGLQKRITITGKVDTSQLVRLYSSAQVAVVPSLYEGFGFPAAEAMACELPVVATTAGALPEVIGVNGVSGLLVPPRDSEAIADAVNGLLRNPHRCAALGKEARLRVLNGFTWARAATHLVDVYREVIGAHRQL